MTYKGNNKYGAQKTKYNGRTYDSKKEAQRAFHLDILIKKGEVVKYDVQPSFKLIVNDILICTYRADFKIFYPDGKIVYEDVKGYTKGTAYRIFTMKKKLVKALYDIDIIER